MTEMHTPYCSVHVLQDVDNREIPVCRCDPRKPQPIDAVQAVESIAVLFSSWNEDPDLSVKPFMQEARGKLAVQIVQSCSADFLPALRGMVDMFERHIDGREGPDDAAQRWDNARDVIARAGGR